MFMSSEKRHEFFIGALLLRLGLGLLFFVAGLTKFIHGHAAVSNSIADMFKDTWLPGFMVTPFTYTLPYMEFTFGLLILLGLLRPVVLTLGGFLMLSLTFGMMVAGKPDIMAYNMLYVMMFVVAFFTSPWDKIKLDSLLQGHKHT
jgi:thiosulfate dehydrogenase (quinone) large subunit